MAATTEPFHLPPDVWRDRNYPTRFITDLPLQIRYTDQTTLLLDYGCSADIQVCRDLISAAAKQGDNVGVDEFCTEKDIQNLLDPSEMFLLKDPTTDDVQAVILISLPVYGRSLDPCLAEIRIFRSRDLATDDDFYGSLVAVAEHLVLQLDLGYTQCMICMADSCSGMMRQLRKRNFFVVATIPNSVKMVKDGLRDNVIMVKHLGLPDRKPRSKNEVESMIESIFRYRALERKSSKALEFLRVPFLPQEYAFGPETKVTFRNLEFHEAPLLYKMFKDVMKVGKGYGKHEYPTYDYFLNFVLAKSFCIFIEDQLTKQIISWAIIGDSCYTRRSQTRTFADCSFGITEKFQNFGFGPSIVQALDGLCVQLGYEIMFNDYFSSNRRMATITQKRGALVLGVIPKGGYVEGYGWDDQVIICMFLQHKAKPFLILAEESLRMHQKVEIPRLSRI